MNQDRASSTAGLHLAPKMHWLMLLGSEVSPEPTPLTPPLTSALKPGEGTTSILTGTKEKGAWPVTYHLSPLPPSASVSPGAGAT
jgi:hypothetical protein